MRLQNNGIRQLNNLDLKIQFVGTSILNLASERNGFTAVDWGRIIMMGVVEKK